MVPAGLIKMAKLWGVLAVTLAGLMVPAYSAQREEGFLRATFGDWSVRCDMPSSTPPNQCALVQSVAAEDRKDMSMVVIVVKATETEGRILRVVLPLGILLPSGLGLKIDQTDIGRTGFVRCVAIGCMAEVLMDDTLMAKFKAGQTATFIVFQTPEEGVGIPITLPGFGAGIDSIQ